MPYKDPEKRRAVQRQSMAKARAVARAERLGTAEEVEKQSIPDVRARAWTFILYPESAPEGWQEVMEIGRAHV